MTAPPSGSHVAHAATCPRSRRAPRNSRTRPLSRSTSATTAARVLEGGPRAKATIERPVLEIAPPGANPKCRGLSIVLVRRAGTSVTSIGHDAVDSQLGGIHARRPVTPLREVEAPMIPRSGLAAAYSELDWASSRTDPVPGFHRPMASGAVTVPESLDWTTMSLATATPVPPGRYHPCGRVKTPLCSPVCVESTITLESPACAT